MTESELRAETEFLRGKVQELERELVHVGTLRMELHGKLLIAEERLQRLQDALRTLFREIPPQATGPSEVSINVAPEGTD